MPEREIPITKPYFDGQELEMVEKCLNSGWVTQGPMTMRFEEEFRRVHKCEYALAVSSCTAALHLAVLALGIGEGDEVLVPAFTWITSASCAEYAGARVRFIDVETETMNMNPQKMEEAITDKVKAVIVVHLFGHAAKMDEIMSIASKHGLRVIEDCACAIGTVYDGVPVGVIGDIGCFSFHPRKAITTGEGGICCTNDKNLAEKIMQLRNHGGRADSSDAGYGKPYYMGCYDELGYNLRMSDIQASVGLAQFGKLERILMDRKRCALYYLERLRDMDKLILPIPAEKCGHTYQSFVIILKSGDRELRNRMMDAMKEQGIQSRPGTIAIHRTAYNREKYKVAEMDFPAAAFCEDASMTLPIYPFMPQEDQDRVIKAVESFL